MKIIVQESEDAIKTFNLLSNLTTRNIINFLRENGPASPSEIARKTNVSPSRVSICLQQLRRYNIVSAKWKTISIDERPLKIYRLVPNILRFEMVLNDPRIISGSEDTIRFMGDSIADFKKDNEKGVYVSMQSVPFRFDGITSDILKECTKEPTLGVMKEKFKNDEEEFNQSLKKLITLGIVEMERPTAK
jgi:predicted transcriptional regulator